MTNENGEHPRAHPRYDLDVYVDYTGTEVLLYHRVQNISLGGVCIQTDAIEDPGTLVDLVINFPELETSFAVKGEVVWANADPPMDVGIRFVNLDSERKEILRQHLGLIQTHASRRRP